ncbi:hypothetical protein KFZ70_13605 [Tamlana fucoidanivorans]|uniref:Glucosamine inositolphosphorylceramide transferase 1 N-terminal domain-containing protein n=1 Tax=Allotamlana fucoidanivorans TaxID=2583814 RepID=A0A5C4SQI3_9FLAO|nr:hypothetical protein [Tamlana fucoidanivorans]TNJ46464.1 hypothetical protein FGF67_02225 [Tamlana fucoidanivorans]
MRKLLFVINSHNINSYLFKCIERVSNEISDIYIEIFIDKDIANIEFSFPPITKFIDEKFNNLSSNPLDFTNISLLTIKPNIKVIGDFSSLSFCDYIIFESEPILDSKYKKLSKKGFLTFDSNYNFILSSILYDKKIPLRILFNDLKSTQWKIIFGVELKKEKGVINNIHKILFNFSIFLIKFLKSDNEYLYAGAFQKRENKRSKLKTHFKFVIYYIVLTFKIFSRKFSYNKLNWKIAIKENDRYIFLKQPKNSFWADPFIIKNKTGSVVFFEELKENNIGRISCLRLNEFHEVIEYKSVLDKDYHLSFPNVFFRDNTFYMIPETSQKNNLQLYKCEVFPFKWNFEKNLMEGIKLVDAIWLYYDELYWIFANKIEDFEHDNNERLYLYYSDDLFSNKWQSHIRNPIIADSSKSRNAGNFIFENNKIYRVSQKCVSSYGENLVINEILELSKFDYKENTVEEIFPHDNYVGLHTMNSSKDLKVFDFLIKE